MISNQQIAHFLLLTMGSDSLMSHLAIVELRGEWKSRLRGSPVGSRRLLRVVISHEFRVPLRLRDLGQDDRCEEVPALKLP